MKQRTFFILGLLIFLVACDSNKDQLPLEVAWGRDVGLKSGMLLSDPRYGVQVIEPSGRSKLFVEIGTAVQWLQENPQVKDVRVWVNDYQTHQWLEANKAHWTDGAQETPMGFGFRAFAIQPAESIRYEAVKKEILSGKNRAQEQQKKYLNKKS
ncbi:MAG: hypothetical protein COB67_11015 [SAR324 cluster bacterium]|uniref:Uncharacterized protein n=1 Tax=SAR324 cluster bacterium TaxID=2024889 RepID=A0A2A4SVU5_9DELT|nr:MAG: hypothetical protein COB67_11015 [SAR324 cluster bacterium]